MRKLIRALAFLLPFLVFAQPAASDPHPPTATPGPTEVLSTATPPPTIVQPTPKPPRPSHTPTAMATRTPSRTATATRTPTLTAVPIYYLQPGDNWLEAERPTNNASSAWQIRDDQAASAGQYVVASTDDAGTLEYRFQLDFDGPVYVWLRAIRSPDTTRPIRIRLDSRGDDPATVTSTSWAWRLDDDAIYDIHPGTHTFRVTALAAGVKIDAILITTNRTTVP